MSRAAKILEELQEAELGLSPYSADTVKAAFTAKLREFPQYEDVQVVDVDLGENGVTTVSFADGEGDTVDVVFGVDEDGPFAIATSDMSETDLDLSPLDPTLTSNQFFECINLSELSWINKSTLSALFGPSNVGKDATALESIEMEEAIGKGAKPVKKPNVRSVKAKYAESLDENVDEATLKSAGGYHLKGTIKIGMQKEADGMLQKVVGFTDVKGDKPDNPMLHQGKKLPGVWVKPEWKDIRRVKMVRKQRHIVTAQALAKSAKTKARNALIKQRLAGAPAAAPAA